MSICARIAGLNFPYSHRPQKNVQTSSLTPFGASDDSIRLGPPYLFFYNSIKIHLQQTYANVAQTRRRREDRKHEMATSSPSTKQHRPQIRHERITSAGCGCSVLTVLSRSSSVFRRSTSTVSSSISLFFSFRSDCVRIDIGVEST